MTKTCLAAGCFVNFVFQVLIPNVCVFQLELRKTVFHRGTSPRQFCFSHIFPGNELSLHPKNQTSFKLFPRALTWFLYIVERTAEMIAETLCRWHKTWRRRAFSLQISNWNLIRESLTCFEQLHCVTRPFRSLIQVKSFAPRNPFRAIIDSSNSN